MGTRTQHKIKRKSPHLQELIALLKKKAIETKVPLWKRLATDLEGPRRNRTTVPITTIQKTIRKGEIAVVSGKVGAELSGVRVLAVPHQTVPVVGRYASEYAELVLISNLGLFSDREPCVRHAEVATIKLHLDELARVLSIVARPLPSVEGGPYITSGRVRVIEPEKDLAVL